MAQCMCQVIFQNSEGLCQLNHMLRGGSYAHMEEGIRGGGACDLLCLLWSCDRISIKLQLVGKLNFTILLHDRRHGDPMRL